MKRFLVSLTFLLILVGCSNEGKKVSLRLHKAEVYYEQKNYFAAKKEIDSIRSLYPKNVDALRGSLTLMRKVQLGESERNLAFCDSLLPIRKHDFEELKKNFVFEKDTVYENIGHYIWKWQTIERNLKRCYVRCGTDEKGEMYLASVFYGAKPLKHTSIKVTAPDHTFAETATIPYDGGVNYRFTDLGATTEVVTYYGEKGVNAIKFIYDNVDKRLKINYLGGRPYIIYMAKADKEALTATYNLAMVLSDIDRMQKEATKASKRIAYLKGKFAEKK